MPLIPGTHLALRPFDLLRVVANVVVVAGIALSNSSCGRHTPDLNTAQITYHEFPGHAAMDPEFELTLDTSSIVRLTCKRYCAVPGEISERIPEEKARDAFDALVASCFFKEPRTLPDRHLSIGSVGRDTITYRDSTGIHEVTNVRLRLPGLVSVLRQLIEVDAQLRPSVELYRRRLAKGWNVNSVDESQGTALETAVLASDRASVDFLLVHGALPNAAAMFYAIIKGDTAIARSLLEARPVDPKSSEARRLLVRASAEKNVELVRLLLEHGLDVNAADAEGNTPLMAAVSRGSWGMIDLLLSRHANPNASDKSGRTLLWLAAESYNTAGIALLARHGAKVDAQDISGRTALMHAAEGCLSWNVEALLKAGADPRLKDRDGRKAADFHLPPSDGNHDKCAASQKLLPR